jgi:hypothetical protein
MDEMLREAPARRGRRPRRTGEWAGGEARPCGEPRVSLRVGSGHSSLHLSKNMYCARPLHGCQHELPVLAPGRLSRFAKRGRSRELESVAAGGLAGGRPGWGPRHGAPVDDHAR